jgi:tryptophan synthase beta chain
MMAEIPYKFYLSEDKLPEAWYNLRADLKNPPPPILNPGTKQPMDADGLSAVFVKEAARQELSAERYIKIPPKIREFYRMYRPAPLTRAYFLEQALGTPAKIYYKFEGNNTSGSHKLNSAIAQAYYAKEQGLGQLMTETGAGQWGTAMAMACAYFGLKLKVYMVKVSARQKPYRKLVMETYGAEVIASPSETTASGRKILQETPDTNGSLGCAISEAIEAAAAGGAKYVLGSVLNHVLLHQSVIGLEARAAMEELGETPDIIIGCAGGGSNLGGLMCSYMGDKIKGANNIRFVAVEPVSCPSLTRGKYAYDFGDTARTTPLLKMYTLGCGYMPHPNHAGGLRYHGMNPVISQLYEEGYIEAKAVPQRAVFDAATLFARAEGTLPAPESAHAIRAAVDEALKCKETGEAKTILFGLSGTGYFDMAAYGQYRDGTMTDFEPDDEYLAKGFKTLPDMA